MVKIHFLNHSSLLLEIEDVKILFDPWFDGTCFEGGWGLSHSNPDAWQPSSAATHLWISHYHSDHFHVQTLKKYLSINPNVTVLGNSSYNFQLDQTMRNIGFQNVVSFEERSWLRLSDKVQVIRYPSRGIDNMLLIKTDTLTILNYNDCVLPGLTQKLLSREMGQIDILMTNFNHAGKLLLSPVPSSNQIKERLLKAFPESFQLFKPKIVIPFASHHYYRAKESLAQNLSLLNSSDLVLIDDRVVNLNIGETLIYNSCSDFSISKSCSRVTLNSLDALEHSESIEIAELKNAARGYLVNLGRSFPILLNLLPRFRIHISDLGRDVEFDLREGLKLDKTGKGHHISAHSQSLFKWWSKKFGTDSFLVGAHFELNGDNRIPLMWQIILGMLVDNKLDFRSIAMMPFSPNGIRFLINRREEILGFLLSFKVTAYG